MATNSIDDQLAQELNDSYEKIPKAEQAGELVDNEILKKFKKQDQSKKLVAWVRSEYDKCKTAGLGQGNPKHPLVFP